MSPPPVPLPKRLRLAKNLVETFRIQRVPKWYLVGSGWRMGSLNGKNLNDSVSRRRQMQKRKSVLAEFPLESMMPRRYASGEQSGNEAMSPTTYRRSVGAERCCGCRQISLSTGCSSRTPWITDVKIVDDMHELLRETSLLFLNGMLPSERQWVFILLVYSTSHYNDSDYGI